MLDIPNICNQYTHVKSIHFRSLQKGHKTLETVAILYQFSAASTYHSYSFDSIKINGGKIQTDEF